MDDARRADDHELSGDGTCLGMFAKYWDVGAVKTRLGEHLGMDRSAELHRAFVIHLAGRLSSVAAVRYLFVAPDSRCDDLAACSPAAWQVEPQGLGDLGERIQRYFRTCFEHSQRVILIGSDCPTLTPATIDSAFARLSDHDAVLGPAADGGYYLIGLANRWVHWMESLFTEIPWSGEQVAAVTRQRLREAGATWTELPQEEDIDTIDCLRRLDERWSVRPQEEALTAAVRHALAGDCRSDPETAEETKKLLKLPRRRRSAR